MSFDSMLTETMDVYSATHTAAESGGAKRTNVAKATSQKCRVEDASDNQRAVNASLGIVMTHRIFTRYADGANGDIFVINDGRTFRLVGDQKRRKIGNMATFYAYMAQEIAN